jgi:WD40 repeat protein
MSAHRQSLPRVTALTIKIAVPGSQFPSPAGSWERPYDVHPNQRVCVRGREDGAVEIWDLRKELLLGAWTAHQSAVSAAAFAPDGQRPATASRTGEVKIRDFATRSELDRVATIGSPALCVAFSPDGNTVAISRPNGKLLAISTQQLVPIVNSNFGTS